MAIHGWLADNAHRSYPFLQGRDLLLASSGGGDPVPLPEDAIVDFGSITGPEYGTAAVHLRSIARTGDAFTFEFRTAGGGLSLRFVRALDDPEFTTTEASAVVPGSGLSFSGPCGDPFAWDGYLTTGRLDNLAAVLGDGQTLTAADESIAVEPALAQGTADTHVRSFNLANAVRLRATAPAGCDPVPVGDYEDGQFVAAATCLQGPLVLADGFNCVVRQVARDNGLVISAQPRAGAGPSCGEVAAYPGEAPPEGSSLLSGGPACNEVITSVNGLATAVLRLPDGRGVRVGPGADPHTVVVDVDLHDLAGC